MQDDLRKVAMKKAEFEVRSQQVHSKRNGQPLVVVKMNLLPWPFLIAITRKWSLSLFPI